jgi:hypothetical protein
MRTAADCINALNGCICVGSPGNMAWRVEQTIVQDIIANLQRLADAEDRIEQLESAMVDALPENQS